jgi:hypothetical protein
LKILCARVRKQARGIISNVGDRVAPDRARTLPAFPLC